MHRPPGRVALTGRPALYLVIVVVVLLGHGLGLYYASSHLAIPAAVITSVGLLVLVRHVALLGPLRRRRRSRPDR